MNDPVTITVHPDKVAKLNEVLGATKMTVEQLLQLVIPAMSKSLENGYCAELPPDELAKNVMAAIEWKGRNKRYKNRTVEMRIDVRAESYGTLSEASVVWGCSVQKALDIFVNHSDCLNEWSMESFPG